MLKNVDFVSYLTKCEDFWRKTEQCGITAFQIHWVNREKQQRNCDYSKHKQNRRENIYIFVYRRIARRVFNRQHNYKCSDRYYRSNVRDVANCQSRNREVNPAQQQWWEQCGYDKRFVRTLYSAVFCERRGDISYVWRQSEHAERGGYIWIARIIE